MQGKMASLGILLVEFAVPLSNQFLWIGFPSTSYTNPLQSWLLITMAGFYNYFYHYSIDASWNVCNFAYFFTIFLACLLKVAWLHVWNRHKERIVWRFTYGLLAAKLVVFYIFCYIRIVAIRNNFESVELAKLLPGIIFYILVLCLLKLYNHY